MADSKSNGEIGVIGLGKMGKNIAIQLLNKNYKVFAQNRSAGPLEEVVAKGAIGKASIKELVDSIEKPRKLWVMLPAGEVNIEKIRETASYCSKGDLIIDGSNSYYKEAVMLEKELSALGIDYLDAGCSGGPSGALNGMSIMVGGKKEVFGKLENLFKDLSVPNGYLYTGEVGTGHFTKMVHNAIEYGMMQSIAEGLDLIENGPYKNINLKELTALWDNGSVIRGYLIQLTTRMFEKDPHLSSIAPYVEDTGEGRWSVKEAIDYNIAFNTITSSLYERFESRDPNKFSKKVLAALRHEFGGHDVKKA